MDGLIRRLMDCGMTRAVALAAARRYRWQLQEFELYVEEIEEASHEPMGHV